MVGRAIREIRCKDVLEQFAKENRGISFITLTTPDVVDIYQIRDRWRHLRHYLVELYGANTKFVMNYEMHPGGHGWHIHSVWNRYIPFWGGRIQKIQSYGFGSVEVRKVTTLHVGEYLTKHCLKAYRGVSKSLLLAGGGRLRLVNSSRGLPVLSDYMWTSPDLEKVRSILRNEKFKALTARLSFKLRYKIAEDAVFNDVSPFTQFRRVFGHARKI